MSNLPTTAEAKSASKFHGPFHEQQQMQAKMRRLEAFRLFLEGKPLTEIADEIGCHYSTIWRYVHQEIQACRLANTEKAELVREQQLSRLNRIAAEAWAGWERSCLSGVQKFRQTDAEGRDGTTHEVVTELERGAGDPRYLEIVLRALADIRELYGIGIAGSDAPVANPGPIRIVTRWGGELGKVTGDEPGKEPTSDVREGPTAESAKAEGGAEAGREQPQ